MPDAGKERDFLSLVPGALSGENNGLSLLLDAETFDYATGFPDSGLGDNAGEGFKVALTHPFDMPIIQQLGINVMPGSFNQIATSINVINITSAALEKFSPEERKCWMDDEINLPGFNYSDGYRYSMTNCLYEATMQVAYKNCSCYPGIKGRQLSQLRGLLSLILMLFLTRKQKGKTHICCNDYFIKINLSGFMMTSNQTCLASSLDCFKKDFYYLGKQNINNEHEALRDNFCLQSTLPSATKVLELWGTLNLKNWVRNISPAQKMS